MKPTYRRLRANVRKTVKPLVLWLNAWRFKQSEEQLARLGGLRESATHMLHREHVRQVRLRIQREQIGKW